VKIFSPAKINLFLAITGRRADGFHELVSVVAPLEFGDTLQLEGRTQAEGFSLECTDAMAPVDESNLVLRAARAFATAAGWQGGAHFRLEKRIPLGAGLGGGSSNAVAALRALNELAGRPLERTRLAELAAVLGSDCPLFLHDGPVVIRGRGERVAALASEAAARLRGRQVLVFKPMFGISTAWAYARMAAEAPARYLSPTEAEARMAAWIAGNAPAEELLFNGMEGVAGEKFLALPLLLAALHEEHGLAARMSGSGSACFALLPANATAQTVASITECVREHWGREAFVADTKIQ